MFPMPLSYGSLELLKMDGRINYLPCGSSLKSLYEFARAERNEASGSFFVSHTQNILA